MKLKEDDGWLPNLLENKNLKKVLDAYLFKSTESKVCETSRICNCSFRSFGINLETSFLTTVNCKTA